MTPKEKIYVQILKTRNAIDKLCGKEHQRDIDQCLEQKGYCRMRTVAELKTELGIAQATLRNIRQKYAIKKWYNTTAGVAYRNERDAKIKQLRREVLNAYERAADEVHQFINQHLGDKWYVRVIGERAMTVELLDKDGKHQFGYDIDFYYGYESRDPDKFEISCSSVGGYDPTTDSSRLEYFKGFATLSTPEIASELKSLLKSFSNYLFRQSSEIYKLENELENPPIND